MLGEYVLSNIKWGVFDVENRTRMTRMKRMEADWLSDKSEYLSNIIWGIYDAENGTRMTRMKRMEADFLSGTSGC